MIPWNKGSGITYNSKAREYCKELFYSNKPTIECNNLFYNKFKVKVRVNKIWREIFNNKERKQHESELHRLRMSSERNPAYLSTVREKISLRMQNSIPWNKNMSHEAYISYYKNGMKGGRPKGYKHTIESRNLMSRNTLGKKHPNFKPSFEQRKKSAERMRKNRQDFIFNFKMFQSLQNKISKPHKKVKQWIEEYSQLNTISNYPVLIGNKYAEIDEAELNEKIAIFIDGNYWHNYPNLTQWDKAVTSCLINKGWKVYRLWESDINKSPEKVITLIKKIKLVAQ